MTSAGDRLARRPVILLAARHILASYVSTRHSLYCQTPACATRNASLINQPRCESWRIKVLPIDRGKRFGTDSGRRG